MKKTAYLLIAVIGLVSCTKIIDIELNSAMQRIVIQGEISDQGHPAIVSLSRTTDYFNPDELEKVSNAMVSISNDLGESVVLQEISPGIYSSEQIKGIPGVRYFLKVDDGDQVYEANSLLPLKVKIDTLEYAKMPSFNPKDTVGGYRLSCKFTDPAKQVNYYTFELEIYWNDPDSKPDFGPPSRILVSDALFNGRQSAVNLNRRGLYQPGDSVVVDLISIDQNVYNYLDQLGAVSGRGAMFSSSAPANPQNNISNGGMGFFTAQSVDRRVVVIR